MNAPDYRTITPKEGDTLPRFTEFRYRDRTRCEDPFILWPSDGTVTSLWEFRVDYNQLTPEEKAKWFPETTPDYDGMTWERWEQLSKAEKLAFNMPGFEAWARGEEVEFQDAWSNWRPNEYPGCCCPLRPKPQPALPESVWCGPDSVGALQALLAPKEGYTEYRKVVQ